MTAPAGARPRALRHSALRHRALRHRAVVMAAALATTSAFAALAALTAGCGAAGTGPSGAVTPAGAASPSGLVLPSFLPHASLDPDRVLTASVARPALTTEGDSIRVALPGGSVMVTVTGPQVPGEGLPYQTAATTCTWTVTLEGATAQLPVDISDFTTLDHVGTVYQPALVAGQPIPPSSVASGRRVSFELRAVMRTGEGLMRWAPVSSSPIASWDFEVETD